MTRTVQIDLIGCGSFGRVLAEQVAHVPELRLHGAYDADRAVAQALAKDLGLIAYPDLPAMLARSGSDAVLIVTPHHTHRDLTLLAAAAGRHIFCEKAMALTVADCHAMVAAAGRADVKLMVGHKRRLRPAFAWMGELLRAGVIGRPVAANVLGFHWRIFDQRRTWLARRAEVGGLLHWAGVHDIDTLRSFFGEVEVVMACEGPKLRDNTDYADSLSALLRFRNGTVVSLEVSPYFPPFGYRRAFGIQIVGEHGGLWYDPTRMTVECEVEAGPRRARTFDDWGFEHAYQAELGSFGRWVLHDEPPLLTAEDGLRCVEIMQAIYIAAAEGAPVRLPLAPDERGPWQLGAAVSG